MDRVDENDAVDAPGEAPVAKAPADERGLALVRRELRENGLPPTVLAALVAWAITLAPAAFSRSSLLLSNGEPTRGDASGAGRRSWDRRSSVERTRVRREPD